MLASSSTASVGARWLIRYASTSSSAGGSTAAGPSAIYAQRSQIYGPRRTNRPPRDGGSDPRGNERPGAGAVGSSRAKREPIGRDQKSFGLSRGSSPPKTIAPESEGTPEISRVSYDRNKKTPNPEKIYDEKLKLSKLLGDPITPNSTSSTPDVLPESNTTPETVETLPDPREVYATILPSWQSKHLEVIESSMFRLSTALSRVPSTPWTIDECKNIIQILGYIWVRANVYRMRDHTRGSWKTMDFRNLPENLARFVIQQSLREDIDSGDVAVINKELEDILQRSLDEKMALRFPLPLVGALVIVREKTGSRDGNEDDVTVIRSIWPEEEKVFQEISRRTRTPIEEVKSKYGNTVTKVSEHRPITDLPETLEDLRSTLAKLAYQRDYSGRIHLWESYLHATKTKSQIPLANPSIQTEVLVAFLRGLATKGLIAQGKPQKTLENAAQAVLRRIPKPWPREVIHTLMDKRVGSTDDLMDNDRGFGLNGEDGISLDKRSLNILEQERREMMDTLHELWKEGETSGRDLKMYMIYIEGLGRLKDLNGLIRAWDELVKDKKAEQLYLENEGKTEGNVFPPTRAFNHIVSTLLRFPEGEKDALELFKQVTHPGSVIKCDIFTVNTVLRHHARHGNMQAMTDLFALSHELGVEPDIITYTSLIQGLLRANQPDMAKKSLDLMFKSGLEANERLCSLLIADIAKSGSPKGLKNAEEMLAEMQKREMTIGAATWTGLIGGYLRGGWIDQAHDAVSRMKKSGINLTRVGYHMLLHSSRESPKGSGGKGPGGPMMDIYNQMKEEGIVANSDTFVILLEGLIRRDAWREAARVVDDIGKIGFKVENKNLAHLLRKVAAGRPVRSPRRL